MKSSSSVTTRVGLLSVLLTTMSLPVLAPAAQATTTQVPIQAPNVTLPVHREAGNCPATIGVWTNSRYYEGGGEHTVVMDMSAIAGPAKFMDVRDRVVIYGAPLKAQYASCVGWVVASETPQYNIWLQFGHAYFRFDLDTIPGSPMTEITYQNVIQGQPYLRWAIAD